MTAIVEAVCRMPISFRERGDVSMVDLLRESGYSTAEASVTEQSLEEHLRSQPSLLAIWLGHSEDQRCTPAHYLRAPSGGMDVESGWAVGYIPRSGPAEPERLFPNRFAACAYYVQRYVESLRALL